jgi:hypothetical protein
MLNAHSRVIALGCVALVACVIGSCGPLPSDLGSLARVTARLQVGNRVTLSGVFGIVDEATRGSGPWSRQEYNVLAFCRGASAEQLTLDLSRADGGLTDKYDVRMARYSKGSPKVESGKYRWKRDEVDSTLGSILDCRQIFVFLADQSVQLDLDPDGVVRSLTTDRVTDRTVPARSSQP